MITSLSNSKQPLVIAYGMGVDSTAVLVGLWRRQIRPDLILFSDVGAEREATYEYLPKINAWLRAVGFPEVTVVKYRATNFKNWPAYFTIEENILTNRALPSIAYGGHNCSSKWKISAQDKFLNNWEPAKAAWAAGIRVQRAIGFEASPHELKRSTRCSTFAVQDLDKGKRKGKYTPVYPLQEWGWDRARCATEILAAGLDVPSKSSCYFCTAMKPWEVDELTKDKMMRLVILEARAVGNHIEYADRRRLNFEHIIAGGRKHLHGKRKNKWVTKAERAAAPEALAKMPPKGTPLTPGIWRKAIKGQRGSVAHPGSMTEYLREKTHLPAALIDALISLTPTGFIYKPDFDKLGISNWQEWIKLTIAKAEAIAAAAAPAPAGCACLAKIRKAA